MLCLEPPADTSGTGSILAKPRDVAPPARAGRGCGYDVWLAAPRQALVAIDKTRQQGCAGAVINQLRAVGHGLEPPEPPGTPQRHRREPRWPAAPSGRQTPTSPRRRAFVHGGLPAAAHHRLERPGVSAPVAGRWRLTGRDSRGRAAPCPGMSVGVGALPRPGRSGKRIALVAGDSCGLCRRSTVDCP